MRDRLSDASHPILLFPTSTPIFRADNSLTHLSPEGEELFLPMGEVFADFLYPRSPE